MPATHRCPPRVPHTCAARRYLDHGACLVAYARRRRESEHEDRKDSYYRLERASGRFSRSLTLPRGIDPDSIEARFEKGVLEVTVPKSEERKPRRVAINVGQQAPVIEGSESTTA
jgi:hypothetical protein